MNLFIYQNGLECISNRKKLKYIMFYYGLLGSIGFILADNSLLYSSNEEIIHFCLLSFKLHGATTTIHLSVDRHSPLSKCLI